MGSSHDPNHRYLSLTGIAMEMTYVDTFLFPSMEQLKRQFFESHPDDPVVLHRKELVNKKTPFQVLRNPEVSARFDESLLNLIHTLQFKAFTVVIDKLEHNQRYQTWKYDPYHYSLQVLIEQFVLWLKRNDHVGDVLAESRGGKEDVRLKASYESVYDNGSPFLQAQIFRAYLTTRQLKIKSKSNNIAGLQIADVIAHPSYKSTLARKANQQLADNFGGKIAVVLEEHKYDRDHDGVIEGWGRRWLP
jgi:hypothetical protein